MNKKKKNRYTERGNALFYVFIGALLFAALGYAVAKSGRGSTSAVSGEKANLAATEILQYASTLVAASGQIRLRGYPAEEIDFRNDFVAGYDNAACTDGYCEIFGADGGAVFYKEPPEEWLDDMYSASAGYGEWVFSGSNAVAQVGTDSTEDLIVFLPYVDVKICKAINEKLGVTNPSDSPPAEIGTIDGYVNKFTGTFAANDTITLPNPDKGKMAACFEGDTAPPSGTYHFYQVLLAR
jgi:hypothetical protein